MSYIRKNKRRICMKTAKQWIAKILFLILLSCSITPEAASIINAPVVTTVEAAYSKATIKKVQEKLNKLGYSCGTADGIMGSKTKQAIKTYQKAKGFKATGTINSTLLKSLNISPSYSNSNPSDFKKKETTVYITDTGEKYHRGSCRYLRKSKYAISLSKAKASGYTPCSVCRP